MPSCTHCCPHRQSSRPHRQSSRPSHHSSPAYCATHGELIFANDYYVLLGTGGQGKRARGASSLSEAHPSPRGRFFAKKAAARCPDLAPRSRNPAGTAAWHPRAAPQCLVTGGPGLGNPVEGWVLKVTLYFPGQGTRVQRSRVLSSAFWLVARW